MLRSSRAVVAARRLALLALFIAVAQAEERLRHGGPVDRGIVPDLDVALAHELASIGVSRVLVLSKHASCPQKIAALVSLKVDARCIPSIEEARAFLHSHEHSNDPIKRENAIAVSVDEDYKVMPTFFWLSHRGRVQILLTYGNISQATGQGPVSTPFVAISGMDGHFAKVFFKSSPVFRDSFNEIYLSSNWGHGEAGGEGSGPGSSLEYTKNTRTVLLDVLRRYNVTSLMDSSCGSFLWMPLVLEAIEADRPGFRFMGTDVACSQIDKHKAKHASKASQWAFQCVDYANEPLPGGYELVFSRDSLQHIPLHGVWQFLNNVKASGAKYLLVGSYVKSVQSNHEVEATGAFYEVDLLKAPFKAATPLEVLSEQTPDGKHLLLFDMATMTWEDPLQGMF